MLNFYTLLEASPWQINFQDPATPIAGRIIEIHHHVFFFLTIVFIFVSYVLYKIIIHFNLPFFNFLKSDILTNSELLKNSLTTRLNKSNFFFSNTRLFIKNLSNLNLTHNTTIELVWTSIPSLILVLIAIPSFGLLYAMDDVMDPDITVKVIGHQWYWNYEYSDYVLKRDDNASLTFDSYMITEDELTFGNLRLLEVDNSIVLPIKMYVRINITASDVLHCWAVPSLGVKVDAVPYRINSAFVYLERPGTFYGQCSEICGVNHGFMPIVVKGVEINDYLSYLNSNYEKI